MTDVVPDPYGYVEAIKIGSLTLISETKAVVRVYLEFICSVFFIPIVMFQ